MLAGTNLPTLMQRAVGLVAHTLAVEYSTILELLSDGSALVLRAGVGWEEYAVGHATVGVGTASPAGYTLLIGRPVIVEDWRSETRFSQPPLMRDHQVISGLCVIIRGQSRPFGVLEADSPLPRSFTDDEVQFLQAVANLLAIAIERIRAEEALRASEARFRRLAEYYAATSAAKSLPLARKLFDLLEVHAHDDVYGGYVEGRARDWGAPADMRLSEKEPNCSKSMHTRIALIRRNTLLAHAQGVQR